jgi:TrmH family RNA methyltransferase
MNGLTTITSRENQHLVNARKARDGRAEGLMMAEGKRLVREALNSGLKIEDCFISDVFADDSLADDAIAGSGFTARLPERLLKTIADTEQPQGIVIVCRRPRDMRDDLPRAIPTAELPLIVCLHEINNPSNLGAVLRTAEAAGVAGVILSERSADPFSPKAVRASMGAAFRLPISRGWEFADATEWARQNALTVTATTSAGTKVYTAVDWCTPRMLVFGSESHGLGPDHLAQADEQVTVPMSADAESLNLAVSAGVILFEARRQAVG